MTMRNRNFARAPRKTRSWALVDNSSFSITGDNAPVAIGLLANFIVNQEHTIREMTVSAIRLNVGVSTSGTLANTAALMVGVAVIGTDAFTAGGVSLPDPAEEHADWMAYNSVQLGMAPGRLATEREVTNLTLHSDSMRKIREGRSTLALIASTQINTFTSLTLFVTGRVLLLGV